MARSVNGTAWMLVIPGVDTFAIAAGAAAGSGFFVAGADSGVMAISNDGLVWGKMSSGSGGAQTMFEDTERITALVYGNGKFIAGGSNKDSGVSRLTYSY
jgi:hypothetical protein